MRCRLTGLKLARVSPALVLWQAKTSFLHLVREKSANSAPLTGQLNISQVLKEGFAH